MTKKTRPTEEAQRDTIALSLTLVLHIVVVGLMVIYQRYAPKPIAKVETRSISRQQFSRNRVMARQQLTAAQQSRRTELEKELKEKRVEAEKKKIEKELKDLVGQIVDLPASPTNEAPADAKYLSAFNTKTLRETKSRFRSQDYKRATNERAGQQAKQPSQTPNHEEQVIAPGEKTEKKQVAQKKASFETPDVSRRDRLALSIDNSLGLLHNKAASEEKKGNSDRLHIAEGGPEEQKEQAGSDNNQGSGTKSVKDLIPDMGTLAKMQGAPANDFLSEDIPDGDGTFLNSREFKFAPFFNRLKQTVSEHWRPMDEFRRRDPSGNIYGTTSRVTVVSVTLSAGGDLKNVSVTRSSGVEFLDKEACEAFQRAQPFPNPPKQLIKDGEIVFAFGFHVEMH